MHRASEKIGQHIKLVSRREQGMRAALLTQRMVLVGILGVGVIAGIGVERLVLAQQEGFKRTPLLRTDSPGTKNYDVVLVQGDVLPGGTSGAHWHHGLEVGYIVEGSLVLEQEGKPSLTLKAGDTYRNDPTVRHTGTNKGTVPAKLLAVFVVEKDKPLAEAAQ